jgi:fatty acid desaturase
MTLKGKMVLSLVIAAVLTAGVLTLLTLAFFWEFPLWSTLSLLGGTILTMTAWGYYYLAFTKYHESLNPKKKRYHKKGNRKESRRRS